MKVYKRVINGLEHTIQYSDADAKALGLAASDEVKSSTKAIEEPANKARKAPNKSKG